MIKSVSGQNVFPLLEKGKTVYAMSRKTDSFYDLLLEDVCTVLAAIKDVNYEFFIVVEEKDDVDHATKECPQWIPCSERLPEEDKDVLITYRYKEGEGNVNHSYIDITSYGDVCFGGRTCNFKEWHAPFEYFHSNYEVIAWCPLPEPYKEKS